VKIDINAAWAAAGTLVGMINFDMAAGSYAWVSYLAAGICFLIATASIVIPPVTPSQPTP
jgi:hypothetical protein